MISSLFEDMIEPMDTYIKDQIVKKLFGKQNNANELWVCFLRKSLGIYTEGLFSKKNESVFFGEDRDKCLVLIRWSSQRNGWLAWGLGKSKNCLEQGIVVIL